MDPSPVKPSDKTSALVNTLIHSEPLEQRSQLSNPMVPIYGSSDVTHVSCFKPLKVW